MSWRLGPIRPNFVLESARDGALLANGVRVTDRDGWINVRTLASALAMGAPPFVEVQLRLARDANDAACLEAGGVWAAGMVYPGIDRVKAAWATFWIASLADGVWAELERRLNPAQRPTRSLRAVHPTRPPTEPPVQDAHGVPRRGA